MGSSNSGLVIEYVVQPVVIASSRNIVVVVSIFMLCGLCFVVLWFRKCGSLYYCVGYK